jgi:hypothetical protein
LATTASGALDDDDIDDTIATGNGIGAAAAVGGGKGGLRVDTDPKQGRDVEAVVMREFTLLRAKMRLKLANAFANLHLPQTNNQFKTFLQSLDGPVIIEKRRFEPLISPSSTTNDDKAAKTGDKPNSSNSNSNSNGSGVNGVNSGNHEDKGTSPAELPSMFKSNDSSNNGESGGGDDENDPSRVRARQELEQKLESLSNYIKSLLESPSNPIGQLFATYVRLYRSLYEGTYATIHPTPSILLPWYGVLCMGLYVYVCRCIISACR